MQTINFSNTEKTQQLSEYVPRLIKILLIVALSTSRVENG